MWVAVLKMNNEIKNKYMKSKQDIIDAIHIDQSNLEYIAKSKVINGTLLTEIRQALDIYAMQESRNYVNWLTNQVIAGRTFTKLWNDYKEEREATWQQPEEDEDLEDNQDIQPDYYTCMCCGNVSQSSMDCGKCAGPMAESWY